MELLQLLDTETEMWTEDLPYRMLICMDAEQSKSR